MSKLDINGHGHEFRTIDINRQDYGCGFCYGNTDGDGDGYGLHGSGGNGWGSSFGFDDEHKFTQNGNPSDF